MKQYELVLIDADGTLFDYDKGELFALSETMESFKIDFNEAVHLKKYREINTTLWKEFEKKNITSEELKVERFKKFLNHFEIEEEPLKMSQRYLGNLSQARFLIDSALELLQYLKEKYKLVLITNGLKKVQRSRLSGSLIEPFFEEVIISEEVGYPKPQPEIFQIALNSVNHKNKETSVIIGDSLTSDIQGGINFGIDTIWYNPEQKKFPDKIFTYQVEQLFEIKAIL